MDIIAFLFTVAISSIISVIFCMVFVNTRIDAVKSDHIQYDLDLVKHQNKRLDEYEEEIEKYKCSIATYEDTIEKYKDMLKDRDENIQRLQYQLDEINAQNQLKDESIGRCESDIFEEDCK